VGKQVERLHYNMTSQPFLMAWGDVDGDGDADSSDESWVGFLWSFSLYDVRADLDLDGDVDSGDYAAHVQDGGGVQVSNDANHLSSDALHSQYGVVYAAARSLHSAYGNWTTRDPWHYRDSSSLYFGLRGNRFNYRDPMGLSARNDVTRFPMPDPGEHVATEPGEPGAHVRVKHRESENGAYFRAAVITRASGYPLGVSDCGANCEPCEFVVAVYLNADPGPSYPGSEKDFNRQWHGNKWNAESGKNSQPVDWGSSNNAGPDNGNISHSDLPQASIGSSETTPVITASVNCGKRLLLIIHAVPVPPRPSHENNLYAFAYIWFECDACATTSPTGGSGAPSGPMSPGESPPSSGAVETISQSWSTAHSGF
jgi:hypothetical protein